MVFGDDPFSDDDSCSGDDSCWDDDSCGSAVYTAAAATAPVANKTAVPRGMCCGREVDDAPDLSRHARSLQRDTTGFMDLMKSAAYCYIRQYIAGGPLDADDTAAREPSMLAAAAVRSPSRKYSSGLGLHATAKQQPGDKPSGGLQRVFHAADVAYEFHLNGTCSAELQIKLNMGAGPNITVFELIQANRWMVPQLLALYRVFEEHGLVDSAARGSAIAQRNYAFVQQYVKSRADNYLHGAADLHLSSFSLLHAGLQALMTEAGKGGEQWPGLAASPPSPPSSSPSPLLPAPLPSPDPPSPSSSSPPSPTPSPPPPSPSPPPPPPSRLPPSLDPLQDASFPIHCTIPTPPTLSNGMTPVSLLYNWSMHLGCYVRRHAVKPVRLASRLTYLLCSHRSTESQTRGTTFLASLFSLGRTSRCSKSGMAGSGNSASSTFTREPGL